MAEIDTTVKLPSGPEKEAFKQANVSASVKAANLHAGERFNRLYQRTIDFGAHPNEQSVTGNTKIIKEKGKRTMLAIMQHGDGVELETALLTTAQSGMVSLEMSQVVFKARFELLGVNAAMLELRDAL